MILTNVHDMPEEYYRKVYEDIMTDPYEHLAEKGVPRIRVTELIGAPLPGNLFRKYLYSDELVCDCSWFLPMMFGTILHGLVEGKSTDTRFYEKRMMYPLDLPGHGRVNIVGTADMVDLEHPAVDDNKSKMVSSLSFSVDEDYVWQLNIYALMAGVLEHPDLLLRLRVFLKDWAASRADTDRTGQYPPCGFVTRIVPRLTKQGVVKFLSDRAMDHMENPFRPCSDAERNFGGGGTKYAVKKPGKDRAMKVLDNQDEAETLAHATGGGAFVEIRPGDSKCRLYCQSRSVCPYARAQGYVI